MPHNPKHIDNFHHPLFSCEKRVTHHHFFFLFCFRVLSLFLLLLLLGQMGKKSKRQQASSSKDVELDNSNMIKAQKRTGQERKELESKLLEESFDNLRFEDPYEDEYEDENVNDGEEDDDMEGEEEAEIIKDDEKLSNNKVQSWTPFGGHRLSENEVLEIDESAYTMHHALTPEWPSLSFQFVKDSLGDSRTRFPHSLITAVGTQADEDQADKNKLTIMKLDHLTRTFKKGKSKGSDDLEDDMAKAWDEPDNENDNEDEDEEDFDGEPILEHLSFNHYGGVNRVRIMPQMPNVVATWSDQKRVNLYNIQPVLNTFERSSGLTSSGNKSNNSTLFNSKNAGPFFTYQGHNAEGYAMDWSPLTRGLFATGDCEGAIHLWNPEEANLEKYNTSSFSIQNAAYVSKDKLSVEDLQWSPTEKTVFAGAECNGNIKIYDTRRTKDPMLSHSATNNKKVDVNVISWNPHVSNLLASGDDNGVFSVWDLRTFSSNKDKGSVQPLARFTCHNTPISSLEWHPTDESMILVTDDEGVYVYDLSIEADEDENNNMKEEEIPPQLLFVHAGSSLVKEAHWHPQIPSLIMSTALTGFSIFVPSNL